MAAIHERKHLSIITDIFTDFTVLLEIRLSAKESFKNFESWFPTRSANLLRQDKTLKSDESLMDLLLLAQSGVQDSQRISLLRATSNNQRSQTTQSESSRGHVLKIKYDSITYVLRQFDEPKNLGQGSR